VVIQVGSKIFPDPFVKRHEASITPGQPVAKYWAKNGDIGKWTAAVQFGGALSDNALFDRNLHGRSPHAKVAAESAVE
jgi:hypothetical protein